jgi:hypothetical protein
MLRGKPNVLALCTTAGRAVGASIRDDQNLRIILYGRQADHRSPPSDTGNQTVTGNRQVQEIYQVLEIITYWKSSVKGKEGTLENRCC